MTTGSSRHPWIWQLTQMTPAYFFASSRRSEGTPLLPSAKNLYHEQVSKRCALARKYLRLLQTHDFFERNSYGYLPFTSGTLILRGGPPWSSVKCTYSEKRHFIAHIYPPNDGQQYT